MQTVTGNHQTRPAELDHVSTAVALPLSYQTFTDGFAAFIV